MSRSGRSSRSEFIRFILLCLALIGALAFAAWVRDEWDLWRQRFAPSAPAAQPKNSGSGRSSAGASPAPAALAPAKPPASLTGEPANPSPPPLPAKASPAGRRGPLRFTFSPDGKDKPLLDAQGKPVRPEDVTRLYGKAFTVYVNGLDVCSAEYAARVVTPEIKRPAYADLSHWERVRVEPGRLAIDPRLGRFQFSEGKTAALARAGRCHIGWGEARDVVVDGRYAYLAIAESSYPVSIYDLSNPAAPVKVGMIEAKGREWPTRVFVAGGVAYIPSRFRTMAVVDVANPRAPKRLETLRIRRGGGRGDEGARSVVVADGRAYVTVHKRGVEIWDVSRPGRARRLGSIDLPAWFSPMPKPRVVGRRLFLASGDRLLIYDVSDPKQPRRLSMTAVACSNVRVAGSYAYLPGRDGVFRVVDVSSPLDPRIVGLCRVAPGGKDGGLDDVALKGSYAFVTVRSLPQERVCFAVIDVSDPAAPKLAASARVNPLFSGAKAFDGARLGRPSAETPVMLDPRIRCMPSGIAVRGDHAYVSDEYFGLWVFDISKPEAPKLVGGVKEGGEVSSVTVAGGRAYLPQNMKGGLAIVDVSNPRAPRWTCYYHTSTDCWAAACYQDRYVYFSDYDGGPGRFLRVLDVQDPARPKLVNRIPSTQARAACVVGDLLFMDGAIYSLADPRAPRKLADFPGHGAQFVIRQAAAEGKLYACIDNEFLVVDITDPSAPRKLGSLELPDAGMWCDRLQVVGRRVLVPLGKHGALLIDVSAPSAPRIVAQYSPKRLKGGAKFALGKLLDISRLTREMVIAAALAGPMLYTADYWDNVYAVDLSRPDKPKVVGEQPAYYGWSMQVEGGYLYRASLDGLTVFDISRPSEAPAGAVSVSSAGG